MRVLRTVFIASLVLYGCGARADVPETFLTSPLAELFGAPPTFGSPKLSPDGNQMIFLQQDQAGVRILGSMDFTTGEIASLWSGETDDFQVEWCEWASETRLLCEFRAITQRGGGPVAYVNYFTMSPRGTELQRVDVCGRNIDWLPEDPEHVLSTCGSRLLLVSINSRDAVDVGLTRPNSNLVMTDGHGSPRLASQRSTTEHWYARTDPDKRWTRFYRSRWQRFQNPFRPVGFGENLDEVLHIAWDSEHWALYAKRMTGDFADRLVFADAKVDVESVDRLGAYDRAVATTILDGIPRQYAFDERVAAIQEWVSLSLPGFSIEVVDESWDQRVYLVRGRLATHAAQLFLVDADAETVEPIGPEYAHLDGINLAVTRTIVFAGADGGQISGHLTLPTSGALPAPTVVMPRARPSPLDIAAPNYLVEFLAANGYAVLRVNQRGPAEYGGNWAVDRLLVGQDQAARDLIAATEFLVGEGIASAGQVCGAGRDVGAYALLMTAIEHPDLLRCIVSITGTTDPRGLAGGMPASVYTLLEEYSPVQRAEELDTPVLLFDDRAARHSESLEDAMSRASKDVTLVEYVNARPSLDETPYRVDMLTRINTWLAENLQ